QDLARGVSVNVTMIQGGARSNVIPDEARAVVDVRVPTMADAHAMDRALRRPAPIDARTPLEVGGGVDRPPLERSEAVVRLYDQAREIARELGQDLAEGAIGDGAHALHEHVELDALPDRAALIAGLIQTCQTP